MRHFRQIAAMAHQRPHGADLVFGPEGCPQQGLFTGTTDDVWFDIGPRAWKLGDDFGSSTTKTLSINLDASGQPLLVRDIKWVRLEKKGICGLTDAPDSFLDLGLPGGATPANLLPSAREKVEELQTNLETAKKGLNTAQSLIDAEKRAIDAAADNMNKLEAAKAALESEAVQVAAQINNKTLDIQKGVIKHFQDVEEKYTEVVCSTWGKILFGPVVCSFTRRLSVRASFSV